ncbi:unnamed protein product [Symbiodinium sp. KB8]|nr:unnamed protein product [Symbiodinium sp. KB8]
MATNLHTVKGTEEGDAGKPAKEDVARTALMPQVLHTRSQTSTLPILGTLAMVQSLWLCPHPLHDVALEGDVGDFDQFADKPPTTCSAELGIGLVQSRFSFEPAVRKADLTNDCKNVTDVQAFVSCPAEQKVAMLTSVSDMGPCNLPWPDMLQYRNSLVLNALFDPFHRVWNDVKSSLKSSGIFRTVLEYAMFFNVAYGPSGTKVWHFKRQAHDRGVVVGDDGGDYDDDDDDADNCEDADEEPDAAADDGDHDD